MYLKTRTRHGVAAKELAAQLGVTYKCARRMSRELRKLMASADFGAPWAATVRMSKSGKRLRIGIRATVTAPRHEVTFEPVNQQRNKEHQPQAFKRPCDGVEQTVSLRKQPSATTQWVQHPNNRTASTNHLP